MSTMTGRWLTALVATTLMTASVAPAWAQDSTGGASVPPSTASTKAERKAARKAAHAKNRAELQTLEKNGYQPNQEGATYPSKLQDAQKKAGIGQAASQ